MADIDLNADGQPGPDKEPESAKAWLTMIEEAEKAFSDYQKTADKVDKLYADSARLAAITRSREFQLFWANVGILGPSSYSRPPVPVVVPRFKDRKPLPRTASEILERTCVVTFELEDIDQVMRLIRDDVNITARGVAWIRYDTEGKGTYKQRACIEFKDRKDFLHDPARTWKEVDWVDGISYLTREKMRERFGRNVDATYEERKGEESDDNKLKARVHEIWCKSLNRVVWVADGCDEILDSAEPHLKLEGFFPCPRPAYATVQRRSLIPVPDMLFYKDQLEEINELTARIAALSDSVKVRGFYPAGAGDMGDAIEAAIKETADNTILVGVSNWSVLGGTPPKDAIVWLPVDMIVATIKELVELRKQLIDDVYQITGLSDIMRGSTDADETLGAQELKSQYGSVRIRDRQAELVRIARDITRIVAEIASENYSSRTLLEMSQMELPTDAQLLQQAQPLVLQAQQIRAQVQQAQASPEVRQLASQNPEEAQKMAQQAEQQLGQITQQLEKLKEAVTVEKVMAFFRNERIRPYVLDIETDSTIAPDENAQKQRATEFMTAMGGYLNQVVPMLQAMPKAGPIVAEGLKYVAAQFRAGRELEGKIVEFADAMVEEAANPKPNPEAMKAQADAKNAEAAATKAQGDAQAQQQELQSKAQKDQFELQAKQLQEQDASEGRKADIANKTAAANLDMTQKAQAHAINLDILTKQLEKIGLEIEAVKVKTQAAVVTTQAKVEQTAQQTAAVGATTEAKIAQTQASTDATERKTDAGIEATEHGVNIAERQAEQQETHAEASHEREMAKPFT